MRCILAAVAGVMLAVGPAWAQQPGDAQPSPEAGKAIKALIGANFADRHCPHYRIVEQNVLAMLNAAGVDPSQVKDKYATFTTASVLKSNKDYDEYPAEFCDFLAEAYGPHGAIPDLIERY